MNTHDATDRTVTGSNGICDVVDDDDLNPDHEKNVPVVATTAKDNSAIHDSDDHDFIDEIIATYLPNNKVKNTNTNATIPNSHIRIGLSNLLHTFHKDIRTLLYHHQIPKYGWSDYTIQYFLTTLSSLDTNVKTPIVQQQQHTITTGTYQQRWVGVGEREGKLYSSLVLQRHYGYAHGIGRSGNLIDPQPKAVGSTILAQLTNRLLLDVLLRGGSQIQLRTSNNTTTNNNNNNNNPRTKTKVATSKQPHSIILPMCTGMSIALVLQSLRRPHLVHQRKFVNEQLQPASPTPPNKDIVLWSRIDQKSCYKAIIAAGLQCIVIPTKISNTDDSVMTDVDAIKAAIQRYTPARILAIITTTSCFAPRVPDQVDVVAKIIQQYNSSNNIHNDNTTNDNTTEQPMCHHIYHIINHAYGLQCSMTGKLLSRATTIGQVDAIVCSLDKNFLVPVSGSIVLSPNPNTIQQFSKMYAGRASGSHIIDICITLLSMGLSGYQQLHSIRQQTILPNFIQQFQMIAAKYKERLLSCPTNTISFAMTLDNFVRPRRLGNHNDNDEEEESEYLKAIERDLTQLGAMLFHRCISGTRVVARNIQQQIGDDLFVGFGSSTEQYPHAYITAACAIGLNEHEMNEFFLRFDKTLHEFQKKQRKK